MKKKSIIKNYIYNLSYQILAVIVPLITTPYLSRILGAEAIGIYSYTLSIATYFVLFGSLGVALYGQREIAIVQDDIIKRSKVFYEILIMRFITMIFSLVVFYLSFAIRGEYATYYRILVLELISNMLDISWFFRGLEDFKKTVIRNMMVKLISVVCIFVFIKSTQDLNKYFFIYVISNLLGNITMWMYLPKFVKKVKFKELKIWKHLKPTIALFIPQIATQIYTVLDKTMIGSMVQDKSEVGFYEQSQKIVKVLLSIATSLGTIMMPRIANTYAKGDKNKVKEYMLNSFHFILFLVIPIMFGIIAIDSKFVPIFFGAGYEKVTVLINIMSLILIAIGLSNVIGIQYLLPTKQQKAYTISVVSGAIVNCIFNFILIKKYASIGASIATVISEYVVTGVQMYLFRKQISVYEIFQIIKNYFVAGIIMFFFAYGIGILLNNAIISIAVQVFSGIIVYITMLYVLKDKFIIDSLKKIKREKL